MGQDVVLETGQCRAGLESQFLGQPATQRLVRTQGIGLATAAVQAQHQLSPQPFAERVAGDQRVELADQLAMPAESDPSFDPIFQGEGA